MGMQRWLTVVVGAALLTSGAARAADAPTSGFRAEFLRQLDDVGKKVVDLANAMPQEKYTWRPSEGVRSVSEVYLHIAGGNYVILRSVGMQPPEGIDLKTLEKSTTDKAKVVEIVKQSFDKVREVAMNTADADLDKPVKFFGRETTVRNAFFVAGLHQHEHLGQSIAYARVNGVVPPWSAGRRSGE